jgi:hypothetical protein
MDRTVAALLPDVHSPDTSRAFSRPISFLYSHGAMYTVVGNTPVVLATRGPDWSRWGGQNMSMFQGTSMRPRPTTHTHQRPFLPSQQNTDGNDKGMVNHEDDPSLSGRPWPPLLLCFIFMPLPSVFRPVLSFLSSFIFCVVQFRASFSSSALFVFHSLILLYPQASPAFAKVTQRESLFDIAFSHSFDDSRFDSSFTRIPPNYTQSKCSSQPSPSLLLRA